MILTVPEGWEISQRKPVKNKTGRPTALLLLEALVQADDLHEMVSASVCVCMIGSFLHLWGHSLGFNEAEKLLHLQDL